MIKSHVPFVSLICERFSIHTTMISFQRNELTTQELNKERNIFIYNVLSFFFFTFYIVYISVWQIMFCYISEYQFVFSLFYWFYFHHAKNYSHDLATLGFKFNFTMIPLNFQKLWTLEISTFLILAYSLDFEK